MSFLHNQPRANRSHGTWMRLLDARLAPEHWLLIGTIVLIGILLFALPLVGDRDDARQGDHGDAGIALPADPATPTPLPPTSTPDSSFTATLETIERLVRQAQYDTAFQVAQNALVAQDLAPADRQQLAQLAVAAGLSAITATPAEPEHLAAQERQVARYREIVHLAQQYQVPLPKTFRQIAGDLYSTSAFIAATVAAADAIEAGELGAIDQIPMADIRFIVSSFYNAGYHLTTVDVPTETRALGLRYLATSCRIDRTEHAGDGLACGRLRELVGAEPHWPEPLDTPLLGDLR